jgi:zinc protease
MNRILGGQFSSRINMNLREKRGYTYGARSGFMFLKQAGPFMASGGFTTAKTDSAVEQLLYEIDRMHLEGITAEELEYSKKGLTGAFALTFETNAQIAGALQNIVLYGLPDSYYESYLKNIERVSLDDVRRVAGKTLGSSTMAVLVVGDLKTVRSGVEKLHLGPPELLDTEGKPMQEK